MTTTTTNTRAQNACLTWISDPGHSWLAVSLDHDEGFPEAAEFASQYSYYDIKGDNFAGIIFLEEDCDASEFIVKYGIDTEASQIHEFPDQDHFVRQLPSYTN